MIDHELLPSINGNGVDRATRGPGEGLSKGSWKRKNMGSSSIGCGGQNSLEAESLRPNSPLGEWINDDDDTYNLSSCEIKA